MNPFAKFQRIIFAMIEEGIDVCPALAVPVRDQFRWPAGEDHQPLRKLNAAFLIALSGRDHPLYGEAMEHLDEAERDPGLSRLGGFYREALYLVEEEVGRRLDHDPKFVEDVEAVMVRLEQGAPLTSLADLDLLYRLWFPEGAGMLTGREEHVRALREQRRVTVSDLNPDPIKTPHREILFTGNVLLTVPLDGKMAANLSPALQESVAEIQGEEQLFWFDHPIPVGVESRNNEVVHGLKGLSRAFRFESRRGNMPEGERVTCLLSVSTTHRGLQGIAVPYLEEAVAGAGGAGNLDVYAFAETDTERLVAEVLLPAAASYLKKRNPQPLTEVFGVDGRYGRHYSFLKAIAAMWQVLVDRTVKGTFKIDLDQVFPQERLVAETGGSAFDHLMTPLWGGRGVDAGGNEVELGMIAGALVNEEDLPAGLFSPDVRHPEGIATLDQCVLFSPLPQAVSTEAEMMARYGEGGPDGRAECLHRIHVTGGTNGILVDSLRRHRPFTPTFIGRAEDQAYLMSVLFADAGASLRYVHEPGLIMRHDKESFAGGAIEAARIGKVVGDYLRLLLFTGYARSLPWGVDRVKEVLDPFTGCFISALPVSVTCLRFSMKAAVLFSTGAVSDAADAAELIRQCSRRLREEAGKLMYDPFPQSARFWREKEGWDLYYDLLEALEQGLRNGDPVAEELKERARAVITGCRLDLG